MSTNENIEAKFNTQSNRDWENAPSACTILNAERIRSSNIILSAEHAGHYIPPDMDGMGLRGNLLAKAHIKGYLEEYGGSYEHDDLNSFLKSTLSDEDYDALVEWRLSDEDLKRLHPVWDIGAREVTEKLAAKLGAPALMHNYSRLYAEANRCFMSDDTYISTFQDGLYIPQNNLTLRGDFSAFSPTPKQGEKAENQHPYVSIHEKQERTEAVIEPYHKHLGLILNRVSRFQDGEDNALISIHTMTNRLITGMDSHGVFQGHKQRPPCAIVYSERNADIAERLQDGLQHAGLPSESIGMNEPYDGNKSKGTVPDRYKEVISSVLFEINSKELLDDDGKVCDEKADLWAGYLKTAIRHAFPNAAYEPRAENSERKIGTFSDPEKTHIREMLDAPDPSG